MNNPYDGMKAVDKNGVVYTYDASLNAWLLPDAVVLAENVYEINLYNDQVTVDMDGAVLSTVVAIALVEPTPVGEILVGGAILVVLAYEWYQLNTATYEDGLKSHCADIQLVKPSVIPKVFGILNVVH